MPRIPHIYAYTAFYALSFTYVPIIIVFFTLRGLTMSQVGFLLGYYYLIFLILELPTGVLADKLGRKVTLVGGCLFQALAIGLLLFSWSLPLFVLVETLFALSRSLMSGADSAFIFDSLAVQHASDHYKSFTSRLHATDLIAHTVGGLLSALLAYYSLSLVLVFGLLMALVAAIYTSLLTEPKNLVKPAKHSLSGYVQHLVNACREVLGNKNLLWLMFYSTFIFILLRSSLIALAQPLLISLSVPTHYFGLVDAALSLGSALITLKASQIESFLGFQKTLYLMPLIMLVSFIGMALTVNLMAPQNLWAIAFYLSSMMIWALHLPVFKNLINHAIPSSEKRATMLSVESLLSRVGFSVIAMSLGVIIDVYSIQTALLAMAVLSIIGTIILSATGRRFLWNE